MTKIVTVQPSGNDAEKADCCFTDSNWKRPGGHQIAGFTPMNQELY